MASQTRLYVGGLDGMVVSSVLRVQAISAGLIRLQVVLLQFACPAPVIKTGYDFIVPPAAAATERDLRDDFGKNHMAT